MKFELPHRTPSWTTRWRRALRSPWVKRGLMLGCALPGLWWLYAASMQALGANPVEYLLRDSGQKTLWLLLITLTVSPLRRLTGWSEVASWRRLLGLWAYAYAVLHLLAYLGLDQAFEWDDIVRDVIKRPFITVGVLTFAILSLLALTSPKLVVRALGGARWQRWHRSIYLAAVLAGLHFMWMRAGKRDFSTVAAYGLGLSLLFAERLWQVQVRRRRERTSNV